MSYKAVVVGASGLIGSKLLNILLKSPGYDQILVLVRRELAVKGPRLTQLVVDFEQLDNYKEVINGHVVFCCLGSTRKKTPDLAEYRRIDHDYPVKLAQLAALNSMEQYHLVSAIGADSRSSNFYTKMKGETEDDIQKVALKALHIYQPSLLTGDRAERRPLERLFSMLSKVIDPLLIGGLKKYRSIPAETVAMAMYKESLKSDEGVFIHTSDQIKLLA